MPDFLGRLGKGDYSTLNLSVISLKYHTFGKDWELKIHRSSSEKDHLRDHLTPPHSPLF